MNLEKDIRIKGYPVHYPSFHLLTYMQSPLLISLKILSGFKGKKTTRVLPQPHT